MPVFNVHIPKGRFSLEQKRLIADALSQVKIIGLGISECDCFIILNEHLPDELFLYPAFSNAQHDLADSLIIILLMETHLSLKERQLLITSVTQLLAAEAGISSDCVFVKLLLIKGESASNFVHAWPWD